MGMRQDIEDLAKEAEWQIREHKWVPSANDHTVAARVAADLRAVVGTPQSQQELLAVTRLGHLREALAAVTIALAYVHGPMAWFLGAAATALTPILHWRAMPARHGHTFGATWAKVFGELFWQSLSNDARLAADFDAAMSVHAAAVGPWVAGARDWGADNRVADIGGGTGGTLRSTLARHSHLTGTLIDLPETVARARDNSPTPDEPTGTTDTAARMTFCPQSFFAPLPPGHDVLLLAHILPDWADDDCVRLLRRCAEALPDAGSVVVVDRVVSVDSGEEQLPVSQRDLAMMVVLGGRERTEHEFCLLAAEAGLELLRPSLPAPHQGLHLLEFGKRQ
ncbi:methyltransferase [Streptomyces anulatus]|uniref:methyltransferase n=1 Tax=Streptomyces anulatus TaxID=1892 RepID=UPI0036996DF2